MIPSMLVSCMMQGLTQPCREGPSAARAGSASLILMPQVPSPAPPVWAQPPEWEPQPSTPSPVLAETPGVGTPAQHPLTQSQQRPWEWEPWNREKQLCMVQHGHHLLCSMKLQESS